MTDFEREIRDKLIERLNLEDIDPETITRDSALFGEEGLGLDSIDALEIEVMIEEDYNIKVMASERTKSTFGSLGELAAFIEKNKNRDA